MENEKDIVSLVKKDVKHMHVDIDIFANM